ncbi:MAG TPA: ATP synthase F1 subunit gamma [Flavobacteriales bacterium]|jgi:F-type H+-transporting ATPase subunit gamma|nr:ATP synthase F1 subunit gamma [Flavobacteriales bacterium]
MPSLKEVRNRITSVNSTRQITSAMKMVAAAKMKKAQDAIVQMRPFAEKLSEVMANVSLGIDAAEGMYSPRKQDQNILIVPITSNRGLCGGFNAQIFKAMVRELEKPEYQGKDISIFSIGKKGMELSKRVKMKFVNTDSLPENANHLFDSLAYDNADKVAQALMEAYTDGTFDRIVLIYNSFKNAATQIIKVEQFLPIEPAQTEGEDDASVEYIFEPSKEEILEALIPKSLKTQLFKALLDSNAAEQGARMTAMHQATDNATALLKELKLSYNKARQAAITKEILEIVSGAEALNE